jgi:hypothetical protein
MKGSYKWALGTAIAALIAFGFIAQGLHAGPVTRGKFKLPFDAQLEQMALPTGDYTFSVQDASLNGNIYVYRGSQPVGVLHAQMFKDNENQSKSPVLICIRHDGNVSVRALRLPNVGTFYFSLPKDLKTLIARQPELIETVSVEVSGD